MQIMGLALLAALAMSAMAAGTASAAPKTLELTEGPGGPAVSPGEFVEFYSGDDSYEWTYPGITPFGCFGGYEGLYGELLNNGGKADDIRIEGDFGNLNEEDTSACNYPQEVTGFPWTVVLRPIGGAKVKGKLEAYEVVSGENYCPQQGKKIVAQQTLKRLTLAISSTMTKDLVGKGCSLGYTVHTGVMEAYGGPTDEAIFGHVR